MSEVRLVSREDLPGMVADAVRRIRHKHPQFQAHLPKRLAQFLGKSPSYAEKALYGQFTAMDPLLLNMNTFFDGLLLVELQSSGLTEDQRAELLRDVREIQRISRRWSFSLT